MGPEDLSYSQKLTTGPYSEGGEPIPRPLTLFL
jgi:hypothetical protein